MICDPLHVGSHYAHVEPVEYAVVRTSDRSRLEGLIWGKSDIKQLLNTLFMLTMAAVNDKFIVNTICLCTAICHKRSVVF